MMTFVTPCCTLSNKCQRQVHSPCHLLTKPWRNCLACDVFAVNVVQALSARSRRIIRGSLPSKFEVLTQSVAVFTRAWAVHTHQTW